jgi:hypothetical protein
MTGGKQKKCKSIFRLFFGQVMWQLLSNGFYEDEAPVDRMRPPKYNIFTRSGVFCVSLFPICYVVMVFYIAFWCPAFLMKSSFWEILTLIFLSPVILYVCLFVLLYLFSTIYNSDSAESLHLDQAVTYLLEQFKSWEYSKAA